MNYEWQEFIVSSLLLFAIVGGMSYAARQRKEDKKH